MAEQKAASLPPKLTVPMILFFLPALFIVILGPAFLQAGAAGYLTKGAALEEMVQAIRMAFAGQRYLSPQIAQQLALKSFQPNSGGSPFDLLSEREIQIALMIANCQKVQTISDKLCLSPKTVNTYRYRIYEKLSITSDVELALLAVRHGMVDAAG